MVDAQNGALEDAAKALIAGELVAFPTETVYGLGANALNERAVAAMEAAVGLAPENPRLHFALAQAYQQAGRPDDATREKEEFLRLEEAHEGKSS